MHYILLLYLLFDRNFRGARQFLSAVLAADDGHTYALVALALTKRLGTIGIHFAVHDYLHGAGFNPPPIPVGRCTFIVPQPSPIVTLK